MSVVLRRETWQARRFEIFESARHFRIESNRDVRLEFESNLEASQVPNIDVLTGDVIEVYKILTNNYDSRVNLYLEKQQDSITRCHSIKLVNKRCHYDLRKVSFAPGIVNIWNSLSQIVISADTTDTFKRRPDQFWPHQDIHCVLQKNCGPELWR